MMWIANLKENLNKIAQDVHDDDDDEEEFEIYTSINGGAQASPISDRRSSHGFAHSKSPSRSPLSNGIDSAVNPEIEQYKSEIKRLQESEAEIKALSINYAALLKEKEDQISRLSNENGSLKQNLDSTTASLSSSKAASNGINMIKIQGSGNQSPNRQHKLTSQVKTGYYGHQKQNGAVYTQDGTSNGIAHLSDMQGNERELADLLEEKNRSSAEMKQLQIELEKERNESENIQLKLQEQQKMNEAIQEELKFLKSDRDGTSTEISKIRNELNEKMSQITRLQMELNRREDENVDDVAESLKRLIATLEKENSTLKMEKNELEVALKVSRTTNEKNSLDATRLNEKVDESFPGKEEMEKSLQKFHKDLKEMRLDRDKALQELSRLKQHLLEKESEESEKMDEDSKIIEELRESNEHQRAQILHLEKALKQAIARQDEVKMINDNEIVKSKELIEDLNKRLESCMSTIDAKNVELLNLQSALGQYYAEIEAKGHLEGDLARAREESAKLSQLLKDADLQAEASKREKEEILSKLSQAEKMVADWKNRVNKVEEDNAKLRRAVEQSMTRLNRMSIDSDFLVDRRIVIKLLVTYFQRNHSKEVLDLMARMLGFSDEDKQRIGVSQGAGKGVVRGVLGLPGRLVGGILGGGAGASANAASENHSFADLWVDFLLKETEEREKRESADDPGRSQEDSYRRPPSTTLESEHRTSTSGTESSFSRNNLPPIQNSSPLPPFRSTFRSEHSDSEFSTVPLTSAESNPYASRLLPRY